MKLELNKKTIISFIPFVLLAVLFWASTILTRQNTHTKDIWLELIPSADMVLLDSSLLKANLTLEGDGFKLLFISAFDKKHPLKVNISSEEKTLSKEKVLLQLKRKINDSGIKIVDIVFPVKYLKLDNKISKQVLVDLNEKLEFEQNFGLQGPPVIKPKSVTLAGPKSIIDTIRIWQSDLLSIRNVRKTIDAKIKLRRPYKYTEIDFNEVTITIPIESYTEKKLKLPVIIDGPGKNIFEIFPSEIEISVLVGLSKYDFVQAGDFAATVYIGSNIVQHENIPVSIVKKPSNVSIKVLKPDFVDVFPKIKN